jgi:hypothetical protein
MPLTKSFNDLVQNRATNDPEFAAALREAPDTPAAYDGGGAARDMGSGSLSHPWQ